VIFIDGRDDGGFLAFIATTPRQEHGSTLFHHHRRCLDDTSMNDPVFNKKRGLFGFLQIQEVVVPLLLSVVSVFIPVRYV